MDYPFPSLKTSNINYCDFFEPEFDPGLNKPVLLDPNQLFGLVKTVLAGTNKETVSIELIIKNELDLTNSLELIKLSSKEQLNLLLNEQLDLLKNILTFAVSGTVEKADQELLLDAINQLELNNNKLDLASFLTNNKKFPGGFIRDVLVGAFEQLRSTDNLEELSPTFYSFLSYLIKNENFSALKNSINILIQLEAVLVELLHKNREYISSYQLVKQLIHEYQIKQAQH